MFAQAARGEATAPNSLYPLTARLRFTSEARSACLVPDGDAQNPGCRLPIGERLQQAYEKMLRHMFRAPPTEVPADLEIAVFLAHADTIEGMGARQVVLETHVVISAPGSAELEQLRSDGRSPILGLAQDSIENAANRASEEIAYGLKRDFANSERVVNWLLAKGIEPVGSTLAWPLRGDWVTFADVGGALVMGGGDKAAGGLLAHVGVAGRWFVVQAVIGRWAPSFDSAPVTFGQNDTRATAELTATDLGVEAGPVLRFSPSLELRAGLGAHLLWGSAQLASGGQSWAFSRTTPAAFAAIQSAFWPGRSGIRVRAGLEVRRFVSTTVGFPELSRTIPVADTYVGAYFGFELPLKSRSTRIGETVQ